jgi:hypothetical protein
LLPFARAFEPEPEPAARARRSATPMLARVLDDAIAQRAARVIPCAVLGNGIPIDASVAEAIAHWLATAGATRSGSEVESATADAIDNRIANLVRLGLIV